MSLLIVPSSVTDTLYEEVVILENREYTLTFRWSTRDDAWYLSIYDQDGNSLALGIRVVINIPLLRRETKATLPKGLLMAVDLSGKDTEPAVDDLGTRVVLMYEEAATA